MKRIFLALLLCLTVFCGGCKLNVQLNDDGVEIAAQQSEQQSSKHQSSKQQSSKQQSSKQQSSKQQSSKQQSSERESSAEQGTQAATGSFTMADIRALEHTEHFAKKTLEHIFDGTINSQGKATGYHYTRVSDSKGKVIPGTESAPDRHGVFTAKVKVSGVKKNGFSSFYPESWTPQQVVDAINEAYDDALSDSSNPHGSLWIGYSGDLEINMYLDNSKRITTAYPIYEGD